MEPPRGRESYIQNPTLTRVSSETNLKQSHKRQGSYNVAFPTEPPVSTIHKHDESMDFVARWLNIEMGKMLASAIVIYLALYQLYLHYMIGDEPCKWLFAHGRPVLGADWQPLGCMLHEYSKQDVSKCLKYVSYWGGRNHIVFMGDSRVRAVFNEALGLFSETHFIGDHEDKQYVNDSLGLKVEFLWESQVNEHMYNRLKGWSDADNTKRPSLLVMASGTHTIKVSNASLDAVMNFKANLTTILPLIEKLHDTTDVFWMLQEDVIESLLSPNRSMITNEQIDLYNTAVTHLLRFSSSAHLWSSNRLIAAAYSERTGDGLHLGPTARRWYVQLLLNKYCNKQLMPRDASCCRPQEPLSLSSIYAAVFFGLSVLTCFVLWVRARLRHRSGRQRTEGAPPEELSLYQLFRGLARFGAVLAYIYVCDRTQFFMKENKHYSLVNFLLPVGYIFTLGIFFTERTKGGVGLLNRDQTDEWKGWMQLCILIYHISGASRVIPIYMHIRVTISAYLFLSGYAQFSFFWAKGNFSLQRFCQQIFRLNVFTFSLCVVMSRSYMFYYFVPLVTYWFVAIYVMFAICPCVTSATSNTKLAHLVMVVKLALLFLLTTILYSSDTLFGQIFQLGPGKKLWMLDESLHEWSFRWSLDRYSALIGMIFAYAVIQLKKCELLTDVAEKTLFHPFISLIVLFLSFMGVLSYSVFAATCNEKTYCNAVHPYISFMPIIGFIYLRNTVYWLRCRYSIFFAWFGKISLELFLAQYHIWLAADTNGILVVLPKYPVLNVIVTSFVFICVAHEVNQVTSLLVTYALPPNNLTIVRNIVVFGLVLLLLSQTKDSAGLAALTKHS